MAKVFWDLLPTPFFALAPMADVTDAAFRRIIARVSRTGDNVHGRGRVVLYTEFVSADGLFKGGFERLMHDLTYSADEHPIVAQFFTKEPEMMERSAALAKEHGFDGVDINMGCPDRSVMKQGAGGALIREPELVRTLIRAAKRGAGELPVSVKTRIGLNTDSLDTWLPELLAEEPAAVTIHARTVRELSKVPARWDAVQHAVAIRNELQSKSLIVGNGDVGDMNDARAKAEASGCDGVMLGRAIFGNPWLFLNRAPSVKERLETLAEHIRIFDEVMQGVKNFSVMKKHFRAYLAGIDGASKLRADLMETHSPGDAIKCIHLALECS